ncbi:hypothetical protein [Nocardioides sp. WS12]|uniref:hypothetical protein n=1 Tax=Nocardioides sp. WS12 TaxID=2486272 RepID=UPI0015F97CA3|nr:hypothetical protein [Nocardioides sp. WS12]
MSFEHRLFDDEGFAPAGAPEIIPIVDILLERLGLEGGSRDERIDGIRKWLRTNQPSRSLLRDIETQGYSEALDEYRVAG